MPLRTRISIEDFDRSSLTFLIIVPGEYTEIQHCSKKHRHPKSIDHHLNRHNKYQSREKGSNLVFEGRSKNEHMTIYDHFSYTREQTEVGRNKEIKQLD